MIVPNEAALAQLDCLISPHGRHAPKYAFIFRLYYPLTVQYRLPLQLECCYVPLIWRIHYPLMRYRQHWNTYLGKYQNEYLYFDEITVGKIRDENKIIEWSSTNRLRCKLFWRWCLVIWYRLRTHCHAVRTINVTTNSVWKTFDQQHSMQLIVVEMCGIDQLS